MNIKRSDNMQIVLLYFLLMSNRFQDYLIYYRVLLCSSLKMNIYFIYINLKLSSALREKLSYMSFVISSIRVV